MAEQLAFQDRFRQRCAIECEKETVFAEAVIVDGTGGEFLPGTAFPINQNGGFAGSHALDELVDLSHPGALACHIVLQAGFGPQLLVLNSQTLELARVFDGDSGKTGDSGQELEIVLRKSRGGIRGVQIYDAKYPPTGIQRNAENRMHGLDSLLIGSIRIIEPGALIFENGNAFIDYTTSQRAVDVHGMIGTGNAIPGHRRRSFLGGVLDEQDRAPLRWNHVKDHTEQLPLQRFHIADGADGRADFH